MVNGRSNILGLSVSQVPNITHILSEFLLNQTPKQIIEIGTAHGGLSVLLKTAAVNLGAQFITYDIKNHVKCSEMFRLLDIDHQIKDCFEAEDEIAKKIQTNGQTILFCDGGNKSKEMNIFIPYLKVGDLILCHDYAPDQTYAKNNNHIWKWRESFYDDFKETAEKYCLEPYQKELMLQAAWGSFRKSN